MNLRFFYKFLYFNKNQRQIFSTIFRYFCFFFFQINTEEKTIEEKVFYPQFRKIFLWGQNVFKFKKFFADGLCIFISNTIFVANSGKEEGARRRKGEGGREVKKIYNPFYWVPEQH